MKKAFKVSVSILMTLLLCFSSISPFAIALSGNVENIDTAVHEPENDISVMSFNILERNTGGTTYSAPHTRAPYVIATIKKYDPDIVGIQEAADATANNDNLDWNGYIATELGKLGYGYRQLSQESAKPSSQGGMTIGAGLMILYKTDRFELKDHDSVQYGGSGGVTGSYQGYSHNDKSRFYHWVKLWDKEKQTYVYTFNTHLSINPSGISGASDAIHKQIGHHRRTQEIKELITHMKRVSTKYPCFATGDYNTHWNDSVKDSTTQHLLYGMTDGDIFGDSGLDSPLQITHSSRMSNIDHVFYNKTVSTALQVHHIHDDFGGVQPSDHKAVVSYYNYGTTQTYTAGSYDPVTRTFTDTTDSDSYTLPLAELPEYVTYRVFDQNDREVSEPLTLTGKINRFTIRFYNESTTGSEDTVFGETNVVLHYTGALTPVLSAPTAQNTYFANNAYHILLKSGQSSITATLENGNFQNSKGQNIVGTFNSLTAPITTYQIKSSDGDIYPLYIYKETLTAESGKHLYIDDNIGDATGTVAFNNEDGTVYLTAGTNGFGTLPAAAAVANTADGYTLHVAPGIYKEDIVYFSKDVSILGNNADISPLNITDNVWTKSTNRRTESVIQTTLCFNKSGDQITTVKGLHFKGLLKRSTLYYTGSNLSSTVTLDISQNIFETSSTDMGSSSCIYLYIGTQKKGRIYDNYMRSPDESTTSSIRILTMRNANGLVFEQNYCIGYTGVSFHSTSEIASNNTTGGYANLTVQYNRFESCNDIQNMIRNVKENTSAHYRYMYNDFVRCGYPNTHALYFSADEVAKSPTYYPNASITVFGNRFVDCSRGMTVSRSANYQSDIRDLTINVQQNRFIDCNQFRVINSLYLYLYNTSTTKKYLYSEKWDCSHNYFTCDEINSHDPVHFANGGTGVDISKIFYPYYTNADLTWLSDSTTVPRQTGITISDNRHDYDGQPHSLTISAGEGAVISYSLEDDGVYSAIKPTLTEPGNLTVYYQVERPGYQNFTGRALITVNVPKRTLSMANMTIPYDGQPHSLTPVYNEITGDRVSITYNGISFPTMPAFTNAGTYTVTFTVENDYVNPSVSTATATLTIVAGEITGVTLDVTDEIVLSGTAAGDTVLYSVNGGTPTATKPTLTGTEQSIAVTVSRTGYNDLTLIAIPDSGDHPFVLSLTKSVSGENILWNMSMTPDREALLTENITLLSYGYVTGESAEQIIAGNGTKAPVKENETGVLSLPADLTFTAAAATPTAAYATYVKDGVLYTVYSTIGAE